LVNGLRDDRLPASQRSSRVSRIRILATEMPPLLFDFVNSIIAAEPDMTMAKLRLPESDVSSAVRETNAQVLIVGSDVASDLDQWMSLLYERPRLKVLVLEQMGRTAQLYALRPHRTSLGEVSRSGLVNAIRTAVHSGVA